jgi:AcrR family transcriptional regulator
VTQPSLHERRRDYTVREISRVAIRLFAERGFDSVTVEDIAAEVGMSARTFFRYFSSKDEVVLGSLRRLNTRLVTTFEDHAATEPPITALRNAYVATSVVAPEDRDELVRVGRFLMDSRALLARSRGDQAGGHEELIAALAGRLKVDPDRDSTAETIVAAMNAVTSAAFYRWIAAGGRNDHAEGVATALDLLIAGLSEFDKPPLDRKKKKQR